VRIERPKRERAVFFICNQNHKSPSLKSEELLSRKRVSRLGRRVCGGDFLFKKKGGIA